MTKHIQARHYYKGRNSPLRLMVVHDMEAPEKSTTAEAVARYFATTDVKASAHVNVDNDSCVTCVHEDDTAFAAPGANADGYQIELAGYARQSAKDWQDAFSLATLKNAAKYIAPIMKRHGIPAKWVTDAELKGGKVKGLTTHAQVTRVFKKSTHGDPGANFPRDLFLEMVKKELAALDAPKDRHLGLTEPKMTGPDVKNVQHAINLVGYSRVLEHGIYDQATADAVNRYNHMRGIKVAGCGPDTWAALRKDVHG